MLQYLLESSGRLVPREELLAAVWPETHVSSTVLKVCVREIRQALEDPADAPRFVETVPWRGYRWIGPVDAFEPASAEAPRVGDSDSCADAGPVFVGRSAELGELGALLERAHGGQRQLAFVTGEAGIGKTSLVDAFTAEVAAGASAPWIARGQCVEHFGTGEPYLPLLTALDDLCRGPHGRRLVEILTRNAPTWMLQLPSILDDRILETFRRETVGAGRERMLRELAVALEILTDPRREGAPVLVLVLEDLHWSDNATLDFLSFLARRRAAAKLMVVGTYRPADAIARHRPLTSIVHDLKLRGLCRELGLAPLDVGAVSDYVAQRFGEALEELPRALHRGTEGNPLFVVNVLAYLISRGTIAEIDGSWRLLGSIEDVVRTVPDGLRELIEKEAEQLSPAEQRLLGAASVAGDDFLALTVAEALDDSAADVEDLASDLARRGLFLREGPLERFPEGRETICYSFVHALYPRVFYDRLPRATRERLHQRIGESIERLYGPRVPEMGAELATHFSKAGDGRRTLHYLTIAGNRALGRFANHEAIDYFTRALELLDRIGDLPDRNQRELELRVGLGVPLLATSGFGSSEVAIQYSRAHELCRTLADPRRVASVLRGLFIYHLTRGDLDEAYSLGRQLDHLAGKTADSGFLVEASFALGYALAYRGELAEALAYLDRGIDAYDPERHADHILRYGMDPGVSCRAQSGWTSWVVGLADRALDRSSEALTLARRVRSPFDLALALLYLGTTHLLRGEVEAAQEIAEEGIAVSIENDFSYWLPASTMCRGAALSLQGRLGEGIADLERGIAGWEAMGIHTGGTHWLGRLAEAHLDDGDAASAAVILAKAFAWAEQIGEHWWEAELHRLRARLPAPKRRGTADPETTLRLAISIARRQGAKALEERASVDLQRLGEATRSPVRRRR